MSLPFNSSALSWNYAKVQKRERFIREIYMIKYLGKMSTSSTKKLDHETVEGSPFGDLKNLIAAGFQKVNYDLKKLNNDIKSCLVEIEVKMGNIEYTLTQVQLEL